jgi:hypothetical protein
MLFTQDRETIRKFFAEAWQKAEARMPLEPMEAIAADIIGQHPELHALLADTDAVQRDYRADQGEGNPFLHLSLHVAVHEQISTDRPPGVRQAYEALLRRMDSHNAEHRMMECLLESLWQAMQENRVPDAALYLECLDHQSAR